MEPQYSVLVYSRYSPYCKRLFDLIENTRINLSEVIGLQSLCIDNEKIRKRVCGDEKLNVQVVPCILLFYPNGGVEKFEGNHAFSWIEALLTRISPPNIPQRPIEVPEQFVPPEKRQPPPPPPQERRPKRKNYQQLNQQAEMLQKEYEGIHEQFVREDIKVSEHPPPLHQPSYAPREKTEPSAYVPPQPIKPEIPERMVPIRQEVTDIEQLEEGERYRNPQQPPRIKTGMMGEYEENPDLYGGEQLDNRRAYTGTVKEHISKTKSNNIEAMAKEMEKIRSAQDANINPNRPMIPQRG